MDFCGNLLVSLGFLRFSEIFEICEIFEIFELVGLLGTKISPRLTQKGVFFTNFFDFDSFSRISPIFHKFELKAINL